MVRVVKSNCSFHLIGLLTSFSLVWFFFVRYKTAEAKELFTPFGNVLMKSKTNKETDSPVFLIIRQPNLKMFL